ncbi:MAG: NINE protein [Hymenobacteraceae bacterium]|nr:NINE protein [Hymenobacteraceae bacterium]MDX5397170.1 NINE protein [Hymenobacteraceae bacterium]MDX5442322.1 NINE protein [Hymenobacteraceae bacterium]MDX5513245.1 NINE protein [Hymenobacteraceae bacterium]
MKKLLSLFSLAFVLLLSACSKDPYLFSSNKNGFGGYHQSKYATAPPEKEPVVTASTMVAEKATPTKEVAMETATASAETAPAVAARPVVKPIVASPSAADVTTAPITKKEMKKAIKEAKKEAKKAKKPFAAGKSQLVALLLAIFLGGLGVHRFYLGYVGTGIIQLVLALTSFLIVPLAVLLVWVIIDIIRIAMGRLKPKNGEYAKTL